VLGPAKVDGRAVNWFVILSLRRIYGQIGVEQSVDPSQAQDDKYVQDDGYV